MIKPKAITLLSGGLDSAVASYMALDDFDIEFAVTFDYGQRAGMRETETARLISQTIGAKHRVIKLPWLKDETSTALVNLNVKLPEMTAALVDKDASEHAKLVWVPNRNGVFIAIAAAIAESRGCSAIVAGFNAEEAVTFSDNSEQFINATNKALKLSTQNKVFVTSPTSKMSKKQIAGKFVSLKISPQIFWCCYEGGEKFCGRCESCARTIRAFNAIKKFDSVKHRFPSGSR